MYDKALDDVWHLDIEFDEDPTHTHAVAPLKNPLERLHLTPEQHLCVACLLARSQHPIAHQIVELEL